MILVIWYAILALVVIFRSPVIDFLDSISTMLQTFKETIQKVIAHASKTLESHKTTIGIIAGHLTIARLFSGVLVCLDIRKNGTERISSLPFVGGLMLALGSLRYAKVLGDDVMLQVNFESAVLNSIFCIFYIVHSQDKWNEILQPLSYSMGTVAILWGYCEWEDPALIKFRYGLIMTMLMLFLSAVPLLNLKKVIAQKDASEIPLVMSLMGTMVTFSWLLYSIIITNGFLIVQNLIGFLIFATRLLLIYLYSGVQEGEHGENL
ncbi:sugar transporter SWEET1-like isoform X2 [Zophobas morio]|uniref:sugar transporter SWEET1-like isoform X2 n=1 Tax=Zophobas morio TaxID=2755281 RepID=UPI003083E8D5